MGKSHTDTGDTHHRRSYVDAVKGMASKTGMKHKLADLQHNRKTAPKNEKQHKAVSTQNNEQPLLVFSSKAEDGLLGLGPHPTAQSLGLQQRQSEPEDFKLEINQQGLLSLIAKEGRITTGPQDLHGPLQSPSFQVDSVSQLHLDRESPEENVGQRIAMESTRKKKTKNMVEISRSKVATGKNGRCSMRVQRKLLDAGLPRSPLFTEAADSGMDPNDSQIENMNRLICKQEAQQAIKEPSPTPNQIWSFLTRIGVKGTTTAEEMVERIKVMEQWDLKNFSKTASVSEMDCAQVDQLSQ
ncbi:hypothetical protein Ancab_024568 [Ancistrocladus abbreviatus]